MPIKKLAVLDLDETLVVKKAGDAVAIIQDLASQIGIDLTEDKEREELCSALSEPGGLTEYLEKKGNQSLTEIVNANIKQMNLGEDYENCCAIGVKRFQPLFDAVKKSDGEVGLVVLTKSGIAREGIDNLFKGAYNYDSGRFSYVSEVDRDIEGNKCERVSTPTSKAEHIRSFYERYFRGVEHIWFVDDNISNAKAAEALRTGEEKLPVYVIVAQSMDQGVRTKRGEQNFSFYQQEFYEKLGQLVDEAKNPSIICHQKVWQERIFPDEKSQEELDSAAAEAEKPQVQTTTRQRGRGDRRKGGTAATPPMQPAAAFAADAARPPSAGGQAPTPGD